MKKYIAIIAVILIIVAGAFFAKSQFVSSPTPEKPDETTTINLSDLFFVQYRIYAPEGAAVTLDGEVLKYNKNIDCFSTEVKKEGNYTLTIEQEGYETIEETVYISTESNEYTAELNCTSDYISEAQQAGKKLLEELMQTAWHLSYDLSEYNFLNEETRISCEEKLADVVSSLEKNISAGYTMGELKTTLTVLEASPDRESSVFVSLELEYSYDWQFSGDAYSDSGSKNLISRANYIIIEKHDGEWYIRDFGFSLSNKTM